MSKNITFILHDESVNTYGFRMLTKGANLEEFRKNPVMLLNHDDWDLPIGRWDNIRIEDNKILADAVFDMTDERASRVSSKVENNFLRAASIGSWEPEEVSDSIFDKIDGQKLGTVTKWTVREASICTIGANHNALVFYDSKGSKMNLNDKSNVIKLIDNLKQKSMNEELLKMLKLKDVSVADIESRVKLVLSDNERLRAENAVLVSRIDSINTEEKKRQKSEAVKLTDDAIKEGRIGAEIRDDFLSLFDRDFNKTKKMLSGISKRESIKRRIENAINLSSNEIADLQTKSWDELDKSNKLVTLRDNAYDLYAEKFKERFGCMPTGN